MNLARIGHILLFIATLLASLYLLLEIIFFIAETHLGLKFEDYYMFIRGSIIISLILITYFYPKKRYNKAGEILGMHKVPLILSSLVSISFFGDIFRTFANTPQETALYSFLALGAAVVIYSTSKKALRQPKLKDHHTDDISPALTGS